MQVGAEQLRRASNHRFSLQGVLMSKPAIRYENHYFVSQSNMNPCFLAHCVKTTDYLLVA